MQKFNRSCPLFDERVEILQQMSPSTGASHAGAAIAGSNDSLVRITIRILQGTQPTFQTAKGQVQHEKVLRIELTDHPNDPFFLHFLEVSEQEFHQLRQDQHLLVDFQSFPVHFMELLCCCLDSSQASSLTMDGSSSTTTTDDSTLESTTGTSSTPAVMKKATTPATTMHSPGSGSDSGAPQPTIRSGLRPEGQYPESYLAVLQLPTSTTEEPCPQTQCADDVSIKSYLAERLLQTLTRSEALDVQLNHVTSEHVHVSEKLSSLQAQVQASQNLQDRELTTLTLAHGEELQAFREQTVESTQALQSKYQHEMEQLRLQLESERNDLRQKLTECEKKLEGGMEEKYSLESSLKETSARLRNSEDSVNHYREELKQLRKQMKEMDGQSLQQNKKLNQYELKIAVLEQKIQDRQEVLEKTKLLLTTMEGNKQELEESLKMYKANHSDLQAKLENCINEINKGNQIIETIHAENRSLKYKLRMKSKIIKQQEHLIHEKQTTVEDFKHKMNLNKSELENAEERIELLKHNLEHATQKLEESNKLLASNQQVISWLNKEINESQLSRRPLLPTNNRKPTSQVSKASGIMSTSSMGLSKKFSPSTTTSAFSVAQNQPQLTK